MAALTRPCGEFLHRLAGGGHAPAQEKQSIFGSIRSKYALAVRAVARLPRDDLEAAGAADLQGAAAPQGCASAHSVVNEAPMMAHCP